MSSTAVAQESLPVHPALAGLGAAIKAQVKVYQESTPVEAAAQALRPQGQLQTADGTWGFTCTSAASAMGGVALRLRFTLERGSIANASAGVCLELGEWSPQHYLFMPAAIYNGNRYRAIGNYRTPLPDGVTPREIMVSDHIPRLNIDAGESQVQLLTSDLSTPAVGFHSPARGRAMIMLLEDRTPLGLSSISLTEAADRRSALLQIMTPGVREVKTYRGRPSTDRGAAWSAGTEVELRLVVHVFESPRLQDLFDRFFEIRSELAPPPRQRQEIPFSAVWEIQERKFNEQNWVEKYGYYSVGMRESRSQDWQTAWVGGLNATLPLLAEGDGITRRRAARTFDFVFSGGLTPSGFLRGMFHEGLWDENRRCFLRYSGDALCFLMRSFMLLESREGAGAVHSTWKRMARQVADAFCRTWDRHGQFGHYAATTRDELAVGGTCAASVAMAGLALASTYYGEARYLEVARAAGDYYHREFILRGLTNGGPGDILQAPDSESCFGLLESYVTLYEVTQDAHWLAPAREVAHQCATWVVNYDFAFPPESTFGRLDMLTTGTVYANVQNKHSAPGICTLSGLSLLKLFRATGDARYLKLIQEIAHAIPQYMSREDRPITDRRPNQRWPVMPPGWINERVNMSDWEVRGEPDEEIGVGEIFGGSTWSEPAMLLTWADLPGVYAQPDTKLLCALDHVEAKWTEGGRIELHNPTKFDAVVKVLIETSEQAKKPLGPLPSHGAVRVRVAAGQRVVV
jgi:hypothetical protein